MKALVLKNESGELYTTSLVVAEHCEIEHASIIKLVRKYKTDFEELGLLGFEIAPRLKGKHGGGDVEYSLLNEDQATYLITLFRNNDVVRKFKLTLVKEFRRALNEIARLTVKRGELLWQQTRDDAKLEYKSMCAHLQEYRKIQGKDTKSFHFSNEAKLVNFAMTGKFEGVDRKQLTAKELKVLTTLEIRNSVLIGVGVDRDTRKKTLVDLYNELTIDRLGN